MEMMNNKIAIYYPQEVIVILIMIFALGSIMMNRIQVVNGSI
ncbi:hypothetical protein BLA29_000969 [Euroglyphus maynei]|uniref:Uncharacterized protein n=1 Tax=Euroglyphus maynei TaxID=6958 RepID=A0A1Y3B5U3_EURMA|nr:hypothetical protein BLA29_000969 [Euroglyphus maynei]